MLSSLLFSLFSGLFSGLSTNRKRWIWSLFCTTLATSLVAACTQEPGTPAGIQPPSALERAIPKTPKSGYHYQSAEEQALQDDAFANPGTLWVDQGRELFVDTQTSNPCAECHSTANEPDTPTKPYANSWRSAAARYPAYDQTLNRVITLEGRINQCRTRYQEQQAYAWESPQLLALTTYVAQHSNGLPISIVQTKNNQESLARGANYYHQRKGQLNLACRHCHEQNPGKMLRGDRLSEGLPTGYPAYKLEWQTLGSLQRRLRDCDAGVRAMPHEFGAQTYADLELYLKVRAEGLLIDTPAVRR